MALRLLSFILLLLLFATVSAYACGLIIDGLSVDGLRLARYTYLLQESGDYLLQENGHKILLECGQ